MGQPMHHQRIDVNKIYVVFHLTECLEEWDGENCKCIDHFGCNGLFENIEDPNDFSDESYVITLMYAIGLVCEVFWQI